MEVRATNKWPNGCRKIVERNLPRGCKVIFRQAKEPRVSIEELKSSDLVISYDSTSEVFIVWNSYVHKLMYTSDTCTLRHGYRYLSERVFRESQTIAMRYVAKNRTDLIGNSGGKSAFEKVVFIKKEGLQEFCRHYEDFLYPDIRDTSFVEPAIVAIPGEPIRFLSSNQNSENELSILRQKDTIRRQRRDPKFREAVLNKYKNTCLVCGTKESVILEAAHIISVADGGNDDVDNGLCLCRNHHKLFDSGLLDVDIENKTFTCLSVPEKQTPWYQIAEQRKCVLFLSD